MVDVAPEFEQTDRKGATSVYSGVVGTSWIAIPAAPSNDIQSFCLINDADNAITESIDVSLDGGTTVADTIYPTGYTDVLIKGIKKQIHIRGSSSSVNYKIILNTEIT